MSESDRRYDRYRLNEAAFKTVKLKRHGVMGKRPAKSPCALVSPSERIAVSHAERFSCITLSTLINQCETITG